MRRLIKPVLIVLVAAAAVAGIGWLFRPEPVPVDLYEMAAGPMQVTVDEEGRTRIKERYVISAPLAGRLRRITLDAGDVVEADETVVAVIEPTDPQLLDARAQAEAEARVQAAEAGLRQAGANLEQARAELDLVENDLARLRSASERGAATPRELDQAEHASRGAMEAFRSAQFAEEIARFELEQARSALLHTMPDSPTLEVPYRFAIRAPVTGVVLRVLQESVAVVMPGTPLLEIGDPADLEVVVDVLSTDAVRITPGDEVIVDHWGGPRPLRGVVRLVEPSAFTEISALGVEEQRVNVIIDFLSPLEEREMLGDGYRVEASIILWSGENVLQAPESALFRRDGQWMLFAAEDGRAAQLAVEIGHRNGVMAEVLGGLAAGEEVVLHPSDRVAPGSRIAVREAR